ncbi:MAG: hypothetical protein ACE5ES_06000 [Candidatus Nanoarchaeia archaeon]
MSDKGIDYIGEPSAALTGKMPKGKPMRKPIQSKHKSSFIAGKDQDLFPKL